MEYSRTIGDIHETYIGSPEEIARFEMLMAKELKGGEIGEGFEMSDVDIVKEFVGSTKSNIATGY